MKKIILAQFIILLAGTLFAWVNFAMELVGWLEKRVCTTGCAVNAVNPFFTPCFYGAIFFTIAFILNVITLKNSVKYQS